MNQAGTVVEELDDWEVLCSFLPEGWEQKAVILGLDAGAWDFRRGALLRILLIHIAMGCSLAETSVRAEQLGLGRSIQRRCISGCVRGRVAALAGGTDALGLECLSIGGTARAGGRCHIDL